MANQAVKLNSSWVEWACLTSSGELTVVFRNGDTATFSGSTEFHFQQLIGAASHGRWINKMLKNWPYSKGQNPVPAISTTSPPRMVDERPFSRRAAARRRGPTWTAFSSNGATPRPTAPTWNECG